MQRKQQTLGDTELEILNEVWERGASTVAEIHAVISERREVAYTTIMTVMKNLSRKGYLSYTMDGRTYVYTAIRSADDVRAGLVRDLVKTAFKDSPLRMALTLVRDEDLTEDELAELKAAIAAMERRSS